MFGKGPFEYVGAAEIARLLKVSTRTVLKLTKKGVIPGVRLGRVFRYNLADVNAALQLNALKPTDKENP